MLFASEEIDEAGGEYDETDGDEEFVTLSDSDNDETGF